MTDYDWYEECTKTRQCSAYQRGRVEALNEVINQIKLYQDKNQYAYQEDEQKPFESFFCTITDAVMRMIEQMKEQSNG